VAWLPPREYAKQLRKEARELPRRIFDPWFREIAFKILELATAATPVDTGRARNGWHVTIGSRSGADQQGGKSIEGVLQKGKRAIDKATLGDVIWIQNNVPYIRVLEFGLFVPPDPGPSKDRRKGRFGRILVRGGYSVQAPTGMLGDAVQAVRARYGLR